VNGINNGKPPEGMQMDDYQEELLEFQAYELDLPEPADDATEL
jgi:hypothetical protein